MATSSISCCGGYDDDVSGSEETTSELVDAVTPCADEDERNRFPDHWHQAKKNGKMVDVLTSRVDADGGLWGGCSTTCKHQVVAGCGWVWLG